MNRIKHIFLLIACLAQQICTGQTFFNNVYDVGFNNQSSQDVICLKDSSFVFVNRIIDSASGRSDKGLCLIDKNGVEILKKSYNIFNKSLSYTNVPGKRFIEATASSYFLAASLFVGNSQGFIILKINRSTLDTVKTMIYSDSFSYSVNNFIKFNDNKYYLIGTRWNATSENPVIFSLDSNAKIVQTITVAMTHSLLNTRQAVYNPATGNFMLMGVVAMQFSPYPNYFMHIDTLGTVSQSSLSASSFTDHLGAMYYSPYDTTYIVIGSKKTGVYAGFGLSKLCIYKFDTNFNCRWQKTYGEESLSNGLYNALILADGSIVVSGWYSATSSLPLLNADCNGVVLKVSNEGYFRWMREYSRYGPGNLADRFLGLDNTKDGGFIMCGSTIYEPKGKAWVIKTDSIGCVIPSCSSPTLQIDSTISPVVVLPGFPPQPPIDTTSGSTVQIKEYGQLANALNVFPNPVNEVLGIEFKTAAGTKNKEYAYELINALGHVVLVHNTKEVHFNLQLNNLKNGLYILQVTDDNGLQIAAKRIVKQ